MLKVDEASSVRSSRVSTNNGHSTRRLAKTSHPAVFLRVAREKVVRDIADCSFLQKSDREVRFLHLGANQRYCTRAPAPAKSNWTARERSRQKRGCPEVAGHFRLSGSDRPRRTRECECHRRREHAESDRKGFVGQDHPVLGRAHCRWRPRRPANDVVIKGEALGKTRGDIDQEGSRIASHEPARRSKQQEHSGWRGSPETA